MSEPEYDVAIIGGGIAGAAVAREASLRNLRVILFEKNTFGSATSSKSSKLIHGGLRYLELAWFALVKFRFREFWKNFRFVCSSLRESRTLVRAFPGLIHPIALTVPFYPSKGKSHFLMIAGCLVYGLLGKIFAGSKFPEILWSRAAILKRIPELLPENLSGGVVLWDHTTDDKALVQELIRSAVSKGAVAFERMKVTGCRPAGTIFEVLTQNGNVIARSVVNATGPWVDQTRTELEKQKHENMIVPVAGSHLEFKQFLKESMVLEAEDGRIFFVINRNGVSRVGTTERPEHDPENTQVSESEIVYLLKELARLFPSLSLKRADILHQDCGIRPLAKPAHASNPHEISREHEIQVSPSGIYHLLGVKITDHRRAAEDLLNRLKNPRVSG